MRQWEWFRNLNGEAYYGIFRFSGLCWLEYLFVSEWFIGIVVSLYLISPALLIYNIDNR